MKYKSADWVRAKYFNNPEDYVDTVAVLLDTYGRLEKSWGISCKINIKCWTRSCTAYWISRTINIGMRTIGYAIQERKFLEWENAEYLITGFYPVEMQIPKITMVHEYAHIIAGGLHGDKCNHGPRYQEVYSIMLDDHFGIGAVKRFEEKRK